MSLKETKRLLNIDQQNIIVCDVVSVSDDHAQVRTPNGKTVRAGKEASATYDVGSQVEVRTDKRVYTIINTSPYAAYAAEKAYSL